MLFLNTIAKHLRQPQGLLGILVTNKMVKMNAFVYPAIDQYIGIQQGMRLLEIGFGPGVGVKYFGGKYDTRIDGIDFSPLMTKRATKRNQIAIRDGKVELRCGDFLECPIEEGVYDRVFFANVTYFWKELSHPFQKMISALKPGGKLVFYMSNGDFLEKKGLMETGKFNKHNLENVFDALKACGFANVTAHKVVDESGNFWIVEAQKSV